MDNIIFNYYPSEIKNSKALGVVSLEKLIQSIKIPKKETIEIFNQIKKAEEENNQKLKAELKGKLFYFTPCVNINIGQRRRYINIKNWTGLLMVDFDHLEENYCIEFKKALFNEYKFIVACWLSASRHGIRALIKIPICNSVNEFKSYFSAIENEFSIYNGFDSAPKNCVLPMFMSYDTDILYREDYNTWTKKHIPIESQPIKQYIISDKSSSIEKIMFSAINKIVGNGHPQLRAAAFALGGYISAGQIGYYEAVNLINNLIDGNSYLSQKSNIYKKTAIDMFKKAQNKPLYIK